MSQNFDVLISEMVNIKEGLKEIKEDNKVFKKDMYKRMSNQETKVSILEISHNKCEKRDSRYSNRVWELVLLIITIIFSFLGSSYISYNTINKVADFNQITKTSIQNNPSLLINKNN